MSSELLKHIGVGFSDRLKVNKKDGSILISIPSGEFVMGDGEDEDCPLRTVYLDEYYIGVYCITNQQYKQFIDETGHRYPDEAEWGFPVWRNGVFSESYADHPVVCVGWEDAQAYCEWAGLVLPSEAQWEKAARGSKDFIYPWGNEWVAGNCLNYMNKGLEQTSPVYEHSAGVSGYGLYNTSGNVLEWCSDWYAEKYYNSGSDHNPVGPDQGEYRVVRGGSWGGGPDDCRSACRSAYNLPEERAGHRGFRVVLVQG